MGLIRHVVMGHCVYCLATNTDPRIIAMVEDAICVVNLEVAICSLLYLQFHNHKLLSTCSD